MDAADLPQVVLERPAPCDDVDRAETILGAALAAARAPGAAWSVRMRVKQAGAGQIRAFAEITDGDGAPVAHRELSANSRECAGLARAVGVWASLVLDAKTQRKSSRDEAATPAPSSSPSSPPTESAAPDPLWPAPAPLEKPSPEHEVYLHHDAGRRTLEPGVSAFLMTGAGTTAAVTGLAPFLVVEMGSGLFLRPSVILGASVMPLAPSTDTRAWFAAARIDACFRFPGLYAQHRGMQLDLCGGSDLGFTQLAATTADAPRAGVPLTDRSLPHVSLGPSVDLRGELGDDFAVTLRGVAGANVLADRFVDSTGAEFDAPVWNARLEVAFSWSPR